MSNEVKTKEKVNMDPKYIIKLTVTLLLTCMVVAGVLGWVNSITKDKIAAIAKQCVGIAREKYGYVRCADLKGNINCSEIIAFMAKTAEDIMKKEKN